MRAVMHHPGAKELADAAVRLADLDPARALGPAREAVAAAARERDTAAGSVAERAWGHALLHCGEMDDALRHFRRSVRCAERAGSAPLAAEARMKMAFALLQRGRPATALREIDLAVPDLDGALAGRALAQRAIVLHMDGRLDEALAQFDAVLPTLRATGDLLGVQRLLINRAFLLADRHAFAAAEADLLEAGRLARQLGRELTEGIVAENLGLVETLRGDIPAALAQLGRAERIIAEHGAQLGWVQRHRAELLLSAGLVAEARDAAERAVATCRRERRLLGVPEVRLVLSQAASLSDDSVTAVAQARAAGREFARQGRAAWAELAYLTGLRARWTSGPPPRVASARIAEMVRVLAGAGWPAAELEARLFAGRLALARRDPERGRGLLREASTARRRGPATLRARGWYAEALLRKDFGDNAGVVHAVRSGLRVLDDHGAALGATDLRARTAAQRTDLAELGLRTAVAGGRADAVFEWAERGRAGRLARPPVRPPDDEVLARLLAELRSTAREAENASGPATTLPRQAALERRIRDHIRQSRSAGAPATEPVRVAELGRALGERALVEWLRLDGELQALTLVDGRLRRHELGPAARVADLLDRLPFALHRMADVAAAPASAAAAEHLLANAAGRLDEALFGPLPELAGRPLVVVPTGILHSLPWSVLPSCAGRAVAVSPSATLWHAANAREPATGPVTVAAGPGLAGAVAEAEAIAAIHHVEPITDGGVDVVLAELAKARLAHLAAHGTLAVDHPLFSSLRLHDGPLFAHDLDRLGRVPHTVVLAACDSGRSVVCTGDELLGLGAAFVANGAAQLVASVVPIPDAETAPLMVELHRLLADGHPAAVALARAQQAVRGQGPAAAAAAAGFVCVGAGS
ncbi:CHAT domain-containing protein [Amycolatopsis sp. NBC_00345]|uniref:CHAT domain-containing protein n=1 Tax=Amycolatopsis sp. NBC_00345 TaxID=2975955 RepID=UPI002E270CCE